MVLYFKKKELALEEPLAGTKEVSIDSKLRIYLPQQYVDIIEKTDNSKEYYFYKDTILLPKILLDTGTINREDYPSFQKKEMDKRNRIALPSRYIGMNKVFIYGCGDFMMLQTEKVDQPAEFLKINYGLSQ